MLEATVVSLFSAKTENLAIDLIFFLDSYTILL